MAKLKKLGKMSAHVGPNMTPMVDIVMCILIFFMLASSFAMPDLFLTNNTAISKTGISNEKSDAPAPSVQSKIEVWMVGKETSVKGFGRTIDGLGKRDSKGALIDEAPMKALEDLLMSKQREMSLDAQIIIQPTSMVNYQDVITIYDACMKAKFRNVAFSTPSTK